ncbi:unnamed protein product [marine sediment metagenome]|uniref:Response regulatory domain-containing protein n=1 Tax=marine sediment metagenome TaxID=412755 RepID=X0X1X9_9ZZZZ
MKEKPEINILVVDDEIEIQHLFRKLLSRNGCRVRTTGSGEKALEMVKKQAFDVIFLDVRLPGFSGHQTLRGIRGIRPDTRLIMMSGLPIEQRVRGVFCEESQGFIYKPFKIREIMDLAKRNRTYPGSKRQDEIANYR